MNRLLTDEELDVKVNTLMSFYAEAYTTKSRMAEKRRLLDLINTQKRAAVGAALAYQAMIQSPEYKAKKFIAEQIARIK